MGCESWRTVTRPWRARVARRISALGLAVAAASAVGQGAAPAPPTGPEPLRAVAAPRLSGHLQAAQLGLVVNDDDPYSVATAAYYQQRRRIPDSQVLHLRLPLQPRITHQELADLRQRIQAFFGPDIQALALVWRAPFAVECNAITAAVTLGFEPAQCLHSCDRGSDSPLFNSASERPWSRHGVRPSMLLAAPDDAQARALIDRGLRAEGRLGRLFGPRSRAVFVSTADAARSVRAPLFPPEGPVKLTGLTVYRTQEASGAHAELTPQDDLIVYQTGAATLSHLERLDFLPGALADHLTSSGGVLDGSSGQTTALAWIGAGASASYGTVSEPCNHLQKFPHPQVLLLHYLQGATALEAYWRSVLWPTQGLFIGDPLAAAFARP
jgi:uncharacterized protein (TIGR03790 family)